MQEVFQVHAPAHWQCVDFISDLHLQASNAQTAAAFGHYLESTPADAIFILGDLFEVWVGDDCLDGSDPFPVHCATLLRQASARLDVHIMRGNRDFLMGERMVAACGAQSLDDPTAFTFCDQTWLLTHGDALCVDDLPYQKFRAQVRTEAWQQSFLAAPLAARIAMATLMRAKSESNKRDVPRYIDLNTDACLAALKRHEAHHMIHGHTHQPAVHTLAPGYSRSVLSDWDCEAQPGRADVLRLARQHGNGRSLTRLSALG